MQALSLQFAAFLNSMQQSTTTRYVEEKVEQNEESIIAGQPEVTARGVTFCKTRCSCNRAFETGHRNVDNAATSC